MKKIVRGTAVFVGAVAAIHHFAPTLHERMMKKCHDMMSQTSGCPPMDKAA